jgi:hypothetical protein
MGDGAKHLSPNLLNFCQSDEIAKKRLTVWGVIHYGLRIWKKLNCYIRENPGEMSAS